MNKDSFSDSDNSDEDFKIDDVDTDEKSEEESDDDCDSEPENSKTTATSAQQKRKSVSKQNSGSKRNKIESEEPKISVANVEDEKKRADSLWSDFLKVDNDKVEVDKKPKESPATANTPKTTGSPLARADTASTSAPVKTLTPASHKPFRPTQRARSSMMDAVQQLSKPKMNTLEKTKSDWESFKKNEGINEDLQTFNKGKNGYLERQDFLNRSDLRNFEIEKTFRQSKRNK